MSDERREWMELVAQLRAEIERLRAERDALMSCRHGDQRCFECPDTSCCDNEKAARAAGGGE